MPSSQLDVDKVVDNFVDGPLAPFRKPDVSSRQSPGRPGAGAREG
jgi:hypothetical protein